MTNREDALRDLAASYDSPLFARVVESMVRSLRFGSSLAEGLESAAAEARAVHRAQVEERVAKAPVKMMVPTGTLILPAHAAARAGAGAARTDGRNVGMRRFAHGDVLEMGWRRRRAGFGGCLLERMGRARRSTPSSSGFWW